MLGCHNRDGEALLGILANVGGILVSGSDQLGGLLAQTDSQQYQQQVMQASDWAPRPVG